MRRIMMIFSLCALLAALAMGADTAAGKAAYDKACKSCHGADGAANPAVAKMMKVDMRDLKSAEVQSMSAADLRAVIEKGKGKMKPVKTVSGADVDNVVAYVKSLKK